MNVQIASAGLPRSREEARWGKGQGLWFGLIRLGATERQHWDWRSNAGLAVGGLKLGQWLKQIYFEIDTNIEFMNIVAEIPMTIICDRKWPLQISNL